MKELIEKLKSAIVESDAVDLMIITRDMEIAWLNERMEKQFGKLESLVGRKCYEALAGDSTPHAGCTARKAFETGVAVRRLDDIGDTTYLVLSLPLDATHVGEIIVKIGDLAHPSGVGPILARRSIRKYTKEPVSADHLKKILEAAMAAPSGKNLKPWHFVVVTERAKLDALAESGTYWKMLHEAPLAIVVCGDPAISERFWDQDGIAAVENALLAVSMLGLGGVWLGCHPVPERVEPVRKLLGIPEFVVPLAILSIGHPAETKEPRTQYDEARVHSGRW